MLTSEKVKAIAIIIHTLIKLRVENNRIKEEDNLFKLPEDSFEILNNDLLELLDSFEKINFTKEILEISSHNISINRMTYYFSVGLKQLENYYKTKDIFSSTLLSIMLLINLIEENKISNITVDKKPSKLFDLYFEANIPVKEMKKMSILADKIYKRIEDASFSKIMRSKRHKVGR